MEYNKDIVEVYKKRIYNELLIEKREKIEKIKEEDMFEKLKEYYNKEVNRLLEEEGRKNEVGHFDIIVYPASLDIKEKIEAVEKEFKDKMDDRDRIVEEVRAMEKTCETGEDYINLYKKYGIIAEDGKIYDYKK